MLQLLVSAKLQYAYWSDSEAVLNLL